MIRGLYDRTMRLAGARHAPLALAGLAFAEGLFFPVPPDVLLMPLVLARRERAWLYASICLVASVIGGSCGYAVGYFLRPVGAWLISLTGGDPAAFARWYGRFGVLLLAVPIPYKITAIASGMFKLHYPTFLAASIVVRGARFFSVAALVRAYGEPIRAFIEKRLLLVSGAIAVVLIGLVLALKLVH